MASLFNVAIIFSFLALGSGILFKSKVASPLFFKSKASEAHTCSQTQCEVCLACVGEDCNGLLARTTNFQQECATCNAHKNTLCWANFMDASNPDRQFKIVDTGAPMQEDCEDPTVDPNTEERTQKRTLAKEYFENHCSAHDGMKRECIVHHCQDICSRTCVDPADGSLEGVSIGCMLKMQACYDSHAGCLMKSVCDNTQVCPAWKTANCPWPDDGSFLAISNRTNKSDAVLSPDITQLVERSRKSEQQDSATGEHHESLDEAVVRKNGCNFR